MFLIIFLKSGAAEDDPAKPWVTDCSIAIK